MKDINELKDIPLTVISDALDRSSALSSDFKTTSNIRVIGKVTTVKVDPGNNTLIYLAIDKAKKGDVIMVDGQAYKDRALIGEIMTRFAISKGVSALIINGAIRDVEEIKNLNFPVFYKSVSLNGPLKSNIGNINIPIQVDNKTIKSGDIIIADNTGIVTFTEDKLQQVLQNVPEIIKKEAQMKDDIQKGQLDLKWVYDSIDTKLM